MKNIVFKNGNKLEISQYIANSISDKIIQGIPNNFEIFDNNQEVNMIINLNEIAYIF